MSHPEFWRQENNKGAGCFTEAIKYIKLEHLVDPKDIMEKVKDPISSWELIKPYIKPFYALLFSSTSSIHLTSFFF